MSRKMQIFIFQAKPYGFLIIFCYHDLRKKLADVPPVILALASYKGKLNKRDKILVKTQRLLTGSPGNNYTLTLYTLTIRNAVNHNIIQAT